jgi:hypothetical protein
MGAQRKTGFLHPVQIPQGLNIKPFSMQLPEESSHPVLLAFSAHAAQPALLCEFEIQAQKH